MGYFEKAQDFKGTMKKLYQYVKPYMGKVLFSGLMSILASLLTVLAPWLLGLMISEVALAFQESRELLPIDIIFGLQLELLNMSVLVILLYSLAGILSYYQAYLLIGMTQDVTYQMRQQIAIKLNRLPLSYFDSQSFGDVLGRATNDVETISQTLNQSLSEVFRAITLLLGVMIIMFILNWILALVVLSTTILSFYVARIFVKLSQKFFRKQAKATGDMSGHVEEMFNGHRIVKVFNYQEQALKEFDNINEDIYTTTFYSQFISGIMFPMQFFIGNLGFILIAGVGALLVVNGSIQVGLIQTFLTYTRQINQPIQSLGSIASVLQSTAAAAERIFDLLDAENEPEDDVEVNHIRDFKGHVVFDNVHFSYVEGTEVIKGFSADIKPGQMVAIVGPTGAGKTTMVNLLMRFYDIQQGKITIDGVDIKTMSRAESRALFGMVLQDTWLFEGTIYENLLYGSESSSEEEVIKASKLAQSHHFIESHPGGYQFELSEAGSNISLGQQQLLTISRAMLANRPMLILDEATSSVDTRTEVLIQAAMDKLMNNRTSFVIAHRLSTIKDADVILVMKDGNIVEQGNHQALLDQRGFYYDLYQSQFEHQQPSN
ncbi:MAG: ABC transporter ATP-binding protein [Firmicutes bacterium]|nr:ABC transporter ATP-binding protein [Bacillota bacterium]